MDHCRVLVQEECKLLIISLLIQVCPKLDSLHLLRLEMESIMQTTSYPSALPGSRSQKFRLTSDGGPYLVFLFKNIFSLLNHYYDKINFHILYQMVYYFIVISINRVLSKRLIHIRMFF